MSSGVRRVEDRSEESTGEIDLSKLPGPRTAEDDEAGGRVPDDDRAPVDGTHPSDDGATADDRGSGVDDVPPAEETAPGSVEETATGSVEETATVSVEETATVSVEETATVSVEETATGSGPDDAWSDEPFPDGPLHGDVLHRVVAAGTAVLGTSDLHGRRDVSVLSGPRCFLRVLDAKRLAFPDEGEESTTAVRANLAEAPGLGMLLVDQDGRRGLHLDGTARVVPAGALRHEHPDLPESPVPGRSTDVWVVVEVGDLYPLDGDDVPRFGGGRPAAAPAPARGRSRSTAVALGVLGVLVLLLGALSIFFALSGGRQQTAQPAASTAPPAAVDALPAGPPVLRGEVREVVDPATVVVDVAGRPVTVGVVGLDRSTVPTCAVPAAVDFARDTLAGQTVTLVPDPTLPPPTGPTRPYYVVLLTQSSYTDAAILGGHAKASGASQYRAVFDREQDEARDKGVGMWGPPCVS